MPSSFSITGFDAFLESRQEPAWVTAKRTSAFEAYIDFVRNRRPELDFFTVDIDHGCGLIRRRGERRLLTYPFAPTVRLKSSPSIDGLDQVEEEWKSSYGDHGRRLLLFEEHADKLLRLRSYAEFLDDLRQDSEPGSS